MALADGRLFHVNVNCSDLERSRRFYVDGLGLTAGVRTAAERRAAGRRVRPRSRRDGTPGSCSVRTASTAPRSTCSSGRSPRRRGRAPAARRRTCGFQRLGLIVPDLDAALERVDALGGAIWSESVHAHDSRRRRDPARDGERPRRNVALELIEGDGPRVAFVAVACGISNGRSRSTGRWASATSRGSRARTTTARTCASTDRSRWKR